MTVKSVLDIDVDDAAWQRFQASFGKYQELLAKTPNVWKGVGKEQAAMAAQFERMTAALMAQNQHAREQAAAQAAEAKHLTVAERLWTSIAHSSKSLVSNVLTMTSTLLRWSGAAGIASGLLGFGGLWGLDRLASSSASDRRSSLGLGMSIGENSAFRLNFGRFIDTGKFLGDVTEMMTDPSKAGPLWRFGINPNGSTEGVATSLLDRLRALAVRTPTSQLGMLNAQYGLSVGTDDWLRLHNMSAQEYSAARASNARDMRSLGYPDQVAKGWTDFTQQMDRAKDQIFKVFVTGLIPLERPLEHLSQGAVNLVEAFMKSDLVKEGIAGLGDWLNDLATKFKSQEFADSVRSFFSDTGSLATSLHTFSEQLSRIAEDLPTIADTFHAIAHPGETIGNTFDNARALLAPTAADIDAHKGLFNIMMGREERHWNLPEGLLETVKGLERSGAKDVSPRGAMGIWQLMPKTAKQYGVTDPFDPAQNMQGAAKFLSHLENLYHGDITKVLAAYNWGEGNVNNLVADAQKNHYDWRSRLPKETKQYLMNANPLLSAYGSGVRVEINNNTGGSASVTVSGLVH